MFPFGRPLLLQGDSRVAIKLYLTAPQDMVSRRVLTLFRISALSSSDVRTQSKCMLLRIMRGQLGSLPNERRAVRLMRDFLLQRTESFPKSKEAELRNALAEQGDESPHRNLEQVRQHSYLCSAVEPTLPSLLPWYGPLTRTATLSRS